MAPANTAERRARSAPNTSSITRITRKSTKARRKRPHAQRERRPYELGPVVFRRGRWYAADLRPWGGGRVTLRDPDAAGWPSRGTRTEHADVADAWKWKYVHALRDQTRRRQLGLRPTGRPIGEKVEEFLGRREQLAANDQLADNTVRADASALRIHLLGTVGRQVLVQDVDAAALQLIVDRLVAGEYEPTSVLRIVHSWSAFFESAGLAGEQNPARALEVPAKPERDARAWTDEELDRLRAAANEMDRTPYNGWHCPLGSMRLALELGIATGGRQAELLALEWGALRYAERTVRFTVQLDETGRGVKQLKGKSARTALVLPSWWNFHQATGRSAERVIRWVENGRHAQAHRMSTSYLWIQRLYTAAKLNAPKLAWHALRHTYARLFIEMGGRLEELQKSLGHKSIVTTEQAYGHFHEDVAALLARQRIYRDGVGPRLVEDERRARA